MDARAHQKIIILTGHDCSGKTTIAKELSRSIHVPYFQNTLTKEYLKKGREYLVNAMRFDQDYILQFLEQTGYSVIFDRAYESEWVYSRVMNYITDERKIWDIDRKFAVMNAHMVICHKDLRNYQDDTFSVEDGGYRARDYYFDFHKLTLCRSLLLNTDDENLDKQITTIMRWANFG